MTHSTHARQPDVARPSRKSRTASTFRLHLLMEERQRLEIGERIRALRERSPFTQPDVADALGIKLRGYQKLEKDGTTKYERCEEIAAIHAEWTKRAEGWEHVSADWIWDGKERAETPDLMGQLTDAATTPQLAAIVESVARVEARLASFETLLLSEVAKVHAVLEGLPSKLQLDAREREDRET